jgi:tetratricopeptide (TPR) repeat protein
MRRQANLWSRFGWAMAALFASFPVAGRIWLGVWSFEGAFALSCVCLIGGTYLYFAGRKGAPPLPDPAAMLEEAIQLADGGEHRRALRLLSRAIRLSPRFWQAWEMRGRLHFAAGDFSAALADFTQAAALAPEEAHLAKLRAEASRLCQAQEQFPPL